MEYNFNEVCIIDKWIVTWTITTIRIQIFIISLHDSCVILSTEESNSSLNNTQYNDNIIVFWRWTEMQIRNRCMFSNCLNIYLSWIKKKKGSANVSMALGHRFPETLLHFHRVRTFLPRMSTHNASRNGRPRFEHTPREGKSLLDKHETAIETFEGNANDQRSALHSFITFDDSSFHTNYVFCFLVRSFPIIISISWPLLFDL